MFNATGWILSGTLFSLAVGGCLYEPESDESIDTVAMALSGDSGHYTQLVWADSRVRAAYQRDVDSGDYDLTDRGDADEPYTCGTLTCTCSGSLDCSAMRLATDGPCSSTGSGDGSETCCINAGCD